MVVCFWFEIWVEVVEWCFEVGICENDQDFGVDMLLQGIGVNFESVLLVLKYVDYIEFIFFGKEGDKFEYVKVV